MEEIWHQILLSIRNYLNHLHLILRLQSFAFEKDSEVVKSWIKMHQQWGSGWPILCFEKCAMLIGVFMTRITHQSNWEKTIGKWSIPEKSLVNGPLYFTCKVEFMKILVLWTCLVYTYVAVSFPEMAIHTPIKGNAHRAHEPHQIDQKNVILASFFNS